MCNYTLKTGYQGVPGSYSEQALSEYFKEPTKAYNFSDFEDVLINIENGKIDYGILPIENSSTGGISETYRLLRKYNCHIVGERCLKIEHHLLGVKGACLENISHVYSHPQGYEQSTIFFKNHPSISFLPYKNTAESAKYVGESNDKTVGAIASKKAAQIYDLDILAENINFSHKNITRFAIISKELNISEACNKISIVITVSHTPGSLYKAMSYFEKSHLNLTKIESRPLIHEPWHYFFYLDFEGNLNNPVVQTTLENVKRVSSYFRILGNYPSHNLLIKEEGEK